MTFRTLYPFHCNNEATCHPPYSLAEHLHQTDLHAELWTLKRGPRAPGRFVRTALPGQLVSALTLAHRSLHWPAVSPRRLLERRFLAAFRRGDAAHVYRGCSLDLLRALRARGHVVFLERINTMDHTIKRIMEDAFHRAGWPVEPPFDPAVLDHEQAAADTADFVFSPSPAVTASLRERGLPPRKILETSYGWDPQRLATTSRAWPLTDGLSVLFVGNIGIRKGAHLLLTAWSRAGIKGRLVLAGRLEPVLVRHCGNLLQRDDVVHLPYNPDLGPVYRAADIFAFPTLEEGSPLVSYEALGAGLPIVTSPMGAGSIIRHQREGLVVEPHDQDALIEALRSLAGDAERRRELGDAARQRAAQFTWDKVAARRYRLIKDALAS